MGNCIVTTLKSVVNNDKLLKLGEVRFGVKFGEGITDQRFQLFLYSNAKGVPAKYSDCNAGGVTSETIGNNTARYLTVTGSDPLCSLLNKYNIRYFYGSGLKVNLSHFDKVNLTGIIVYGDCTGDITGLLKSLTSEQTTREINVTGTFTGDLSKAGLNPINIASFYVYSPNVHGTLNNLGYVSTALSTVTCPNTKNVDLDIVTFVKKARKNNISKDSWLTFSGVRKIVTTIDGESISGTITSLKLKWDNNTITYNTGDSDIVINNSEVEP